MTYLLYVFLLGFLLTAVIGFLASWFDRKLTARLQYRIGPPLLQPLYDFLKLLEKETLIPKASSRFTFVSAPIVGLISAITVSAILWASNMDPQKT